MPLSVRTASERAIQGFLLLTGALYANSERRKGCRLWRLKRFQSMRTSHAYWTRLLTAETAMNTAMVESLSDPAIRQL